MSANTIVDLQGAAGLFSTIPAGGAGSGLVYAASGAVIGNSCNMINCNNATNVFVQACGVFGSGQLRLQIQTSDSDVSGNYTDPTSGLAQLPSWVSSGGLIWLNSGGLLGGDFAVPNYSLSDNSVKSGQPLSGHAIQSGVAVAAFFQRLGTFARVNVLSGDFFAGTLQVALVGELKVKGSGGGAYWGPGSGPAGPFVGAGVINV